MTINNEDLINSILQSLGRIEHIKPEELPNIDLYMDQLTTFMDQRLKNTTRNPEEDKILTKTMINNYAKNNLLPSPEKKKYNKEHMLMLLFIYYFKGVMSMGDIQTLLGPIKDEFFASEGPCSLEDVYREVFSMEKHEVEHLQEDLTRKFAIAQDTFDNLLVKDEEFMKLFSFICQLSFDVYVKRLLIEKMLDGVIAPYVEKKEKIKSARSAKAKMQKEREKAKAKAQAQREKEKAKARSRAESAKAMHETRRKA